MSFWSSVGKFAKDNAADLIGGAVQVYGANRASNAASKAAKQQAAAYQQANAQQQAAFQQAQAQQAPYAAQGQQAANTLAGMSHGGQGGLLRNFQASDMQSDPGYQYRLAEGQKGIEQMAAARGKRMSGGHMKGISDYNQAMAGQEYGRAYDRYNQNRTSNYNMLAGQMNAGRGASGTIGNYMALAGDAGAKNLYGIGGANSAATISGNNAWNNALANTVQPWQIRGFFT
jgi:hypothetical protein